MDGRIPRLARRKTLTTETERACAKSAAVSAWPDLAIRSANVLSILGSHSAAENLEQGAVHHLPVTRTGIEFEFWRDLCITKLVSVLAITADQAKFTDFVPNSKSLGLNTVAIFNT